MTDPVTPSALVPYNTSTSTTWQTFYADVAPVNLGAAFVDGANASTTFTPGSLGYYTGYVTGIPAATITEQPASGVTENGTTCTAGLPGGVGVRRIRQQLLRRHR